MEAKYSKVDISVSKKSWVIIPSVFGFVRIRLFIKEDETVWVSFWFIEIFGFVIGGRPPGWFFDKKLMVAPGENNEF